MSEIDHDHQRSSTEGIADDPHREPKTERVPPGDEPAWARRVFVATQTASSLSVARRKWPLLFLVAVAIGVVWLTIGRGPSKATLERQALQTDFIQLQEQVQSLSGEVGRLTAAGEQRDHKLADAKETAAGFETRLASMQTRMDSAERRSASRKAAATTAAIAPATQKPTDSAPVDETDAAPAGPVLVQTFRNVTVRLDEAVREGTDVRMVFVVTATERDTPLRIDNDGARLNFADGTRYAKYAWISTNEWRKAYLAGFNLVAGVPRRFTVEWSGVRTDAMEVAVMELTGDLRGARTNYAMKFTNIPLD